MSPDCRGHGKKGSVMQVPLGGAASFGATRIAMPAWASRFAHMSHQRARGVAFDTICIEGLRWSEIAFVLPPTPGCCHEATAKGIPAAEGSASTTLLGSQIEHPPRLALEAAKTVTSGGFADGDRLDAVRSTKRWRARTP
jgi:hypothetical protein